MAMSLADPPAASSHALAALMLVAREIARSHGLRWPPSNEEIFAAMNVDPAVAAELADELAAWLPTMEPEPVVAITAKAFDFVAQHPGCVQVSDAGVRYSARYRRFVKNLRQQYPEVSTAELAKALHLPLGTLEDLLAGKASKQRARGAMIVAARPLVARPA
jgi:hypothetical protein